MQNHQILRRQVFREEQEKHHGTRPRKMVVQKNHHFVKITYLFCRSSKKRKGVGSVRESPTGLIHVIFDMRNLKSSDGFGLGVEAGLCFNSLQKGACFAFCASNIFTYHLISV